MNKKLGFLTLAAVAAFVPLFFQTQRSQSPATGNNAALIAGMGALAGAVEAPKPFRAAKVYARNVEKGIRYIVYTQNGQYRAVNLFPGNYEVTVKKNGFATDTQKVTIKAGGSATLDFSLREAPPEEVQRPGFVGPPRVTGWDRANVTLLPYDELYPPGPERDLVKKTCLRCHGLNFFPSRPRSEAQWNAAIDLMSKPLTEAREIEIPPGSLKPEDRKTIVAYLAKHFGPGSPKRAVRVDSEAMEAILDEQALGRAMFVEYELPLDPQLDAKNTARDARDPHLDREGNVWYTDQSQPHRVGRLDPRTAKFKDYVVPAAPHGLTIDQRGEVWVVENTGFHLDRLNPQTGQVVRYYMDPKGEVLAGHAHSAVADSRQNVWFSVNVGNRLGKWDRKTEKVALWELPTPYSWPIGIAADPQDNIWLAELHGCNVAKFDPRTERFTEYPALSRPCTIGRVGVDAQGTVWYGVSSSAKLGKLDPRTGKIFEYAIPTPLSEPYDTWPDRQGNIWMSDTGYGGALIRFDSRSEKFTYFPSPEGARFSKLEITREGAVWYGYGTDTISAVGVLYPDVTRMTTLAAYD